MFQARFFANVYFMPRYWMNVGADPSGFNPAWASASNIVMGSGNTVLGGEQS